MFKTIIIIAIIGLFQADEKDDFLLPDKFYRINFINTSVDTIISIFGNKYTSDTTFMALISGGDGAAHIVYASEKLWFNFYAPNKESKFRFSSFSIGPGSPITFGKLQFKTSVSSIKEIVQTYGPPEKTESDVYDSIYSYIRTKTKREYRFWFDKNNKILRYVEVKPTN